MHKTDRLYQRQWGVFSHYLFTCQNDPEHPSSLGHVSTPWEDCVAALDVNLLASQLASVGTGYMVLTIMQGTRFLCAPNDTFDHIAGFQPGEACSLSDLPMKLYKALQEKGVDLYLYYTGDGPHLDAVAGHRFGFVSPRKNVTEAFVKRWADVLREYSLRYGDRVKGWWIDGCYRSAFGYTEPLLGILADAARAGNPNSLVALNNGVFEHVVRYSRHEDFTCGEMNDFMDLPCSRFIDGVQWHLLAPLGVSSNGVEWNAWCSPGAKRSGAYMRDYVRNVNDCGGVITIDVLLRRDGSIDPEQLDVLDRIGRLRR